MKNFTIHTYTFILNEKNIEYTQNGTENETNDASFYWYHINIPITSR